MQKEERANSSLSPLRKFLTIDIANTTQKLPDISFQSTRNVTPFKSNSSFRKESLSPLNRTTANATQLNTRSEKKARALNLSVEEVMHMGSKKFNTFGIPEYKAPSTDLKFKQPKSIKFNKNATPGFIETITKQKESLPSVLKYAVYENWENRQSPSAKMAKSSRTLPAEAVGNAKSYIPGPGAYELMIKTKLIGNYNYKEERGRVTDQAEYLAMQTPGHVYNANYDTVNPRSLSSKIYPSQKERFKKLEKNDEPSPGQYDSLFSFLKTQTKKRVTNFSKSVVPTATANSAEAKIRETKHVPGVGSYNPETAYKILSPSRLKHY